MLMLGLCIFKRFYWADKLNFKIADSARQDFKMNVNIKFIFDSVSLSLPFPTNYQSSLPLIIQFMNSLQ